MVMLAELSAINLAAKALEAVARMPHLEVLKAIYFQERVIHGVTAKVKEVLLHLQSKSEEEVRPWLSFAVDANVSFDQNPLQCLPS